MISACGRSWRRWPTRRIAPNRAAAQEKSTFSLLGTGQLAALATEPSEDWLIAHELAHQFWGNLVTPKSWNEMWLSEGLVTFLTAGQKCHLCSRLHLF